MEKFLSATLEEVTRLSATDFYDFIVVGSGIGGGVLTRTLIDQSERQEKQSKGQEKSPRVLLIEQGGLLFSTHCLNTSCPQWNSSISEGPSQDNDIVYRAVKGNISTTTSKSHEYGGGPVHCLGGRSNVWGLYSPRIHVREADKYFPKAIREYLFPYPASPAYNRAYKVLSNDDHANLDKPYPRNGAVGSPSIQAISNVIGTLGKTGWKFDCCAMGAEFTRRNPERKLYQLSRGAYSTVNWILDRAYNKVENLTILAQTQVLTVNKTVSSIISTNAAQDNETSNTSAIAGLTVRNSRGKERILPVGRNTKVILCAGTIDTAVIALRSGIGNEKEKNMVGRGLMDHDIWGVRIEMLVGEEVQALRDQPLKLESWVNFCMCKRECNCTSGELVLLNVAINATTFLGQGERKFDTAYIDQQGKLISQPAFEDEQKKPGVKKSTIQVVYEFCAPLDDDNKVLNLPEPTPTVLIKNLPDNSKYLEKMERLVNQIVDLLGPKSGIDVFRPAGPGDARSNIRLSKADFGVVAHEVGTMRMGADTKSPRVVDENLKVDGWGNLFVCDLSVFPVSPAANPSLTLAALAQRLGSHLLGGAWVDDDVSDNDQSGHEDDWICPLHPHYSSTVVQDQPKKQV